MPSVTATKVKKKTIATTLSSPGIVLRQLVLDVLDQRVVLAVGPADVDARQEPGGQDDSDPDRDAERDVRRNLDSEDALLERDQEDEAVVDDQGDEGEQKRDAGLAR